MRISDEVINHIKSNTAIKLVFVEAFNVHFLTVERWFNQNREEGPLTTARGLQIIKANTPFKQDADILISQPIAV